MHARDRLIAAASRQLSIRLQGEKALASPLVAAEKAVEGPGDKKSGVDLEALKELARRVVETVLDLKRQRLSIKDLEAAVKRGAEGYLLSKPGLPRAYAACLASEMSWLINLPRLVRLAATGLEISPLVAASPPGQPEIINSPSQAFKRVLRDLELVAETELPVLLIGETGTGKELLARRLHLCSPGRKGPFVPVNCAALSPNLLESEFFGHVKGAFTGADQAKEGYTQAAQNGTLFLDEIAETKPEFQVRLLRVLEERMVTPVGATQGMPVNFRLVCASHLDLEQAARQGRFNQALIYGINMVPISFPPLRKRPEDIAILIDYFLKQACLLTKCSRRLLPDTREILMQYNWPGNVRELSHVIQRLVALSPDHEVGPDQLPAHLLPGKGSVPWKLLMKRLTTVPGMEEDRKRRLAELLLTVKNGHITNKDVRGTLNCSDSTAKNILRRLCQAGILEAIGRRGGRRYQIFPSEEN